MGGSRRSAIRVTHCISHQRKWDERRRIFDGITLATLPEKGNEETRNSERQTEREKTLNNRKYWGRSNTLWRSLQCDVHSLWRREERKKEKKGGERNRQSHRHFDSREIRLSCGHITRILVWVECPRLKNAFELPVNIRRIKMQRPMNPILPRPRRVSSMNTLVQPRSLPTPIIINPLLQVSESFRGESERSLTLDWNVRQCLVTVKYWYLIIEI